MVLDNKKTNFYYMAFVWGLIGGVTFLTSKLTALFFFAMAIGCFYVDFRKRKKN